MSSRIPINDQSDIVNAIKAALAEVELTGTLEIEAPRQKCSERQTKKLPLFMPMFWERNGSVVAYDFHNVREALRALGIVYRRSFDTVDFKGRELCLWEKDGINPIWFAIQKHFHFRPSKRFLLDVIREVRASIFEEDAS